VASFKYVILYVKDIVVSKSFYSMLLGLTAKELSPTFVSYELESGLVLELWQLDKVQPPASFSGSGGEICMVLPDSISLQSSYEKWKKKGVTFVSEPTRAVFGMTFVALDPDGHRLRVNAGI